MSADLKKQYYSKFRDELVKELKLKNIYQCPNLEKIIVSSGIGRATSDPKILESMREDLGLITGQKPAYAVAKKDISNFNRLRKGNVIGLYVTLRKDRMWDMFEKLVDLVLPGQKDFRGLSKKSLDDKGNYNLGIREQTAFFEVDQNKIDKAHGLQVTIVTTAQNRESSYALFKKLGFPFND